MTASGPLVMSRDSNSERHIQLEGSAHDSSQGSDTSTVVHPEASRISALINKWEVHIPLASQERAKPTANQGGVSSEIPAGDGIHDNDELSDFTPLTESALLEYNHQREATENVETKTTNENNNNSENNNNENNNNDDDNLDTRNRTARVQNSETRQDRGNDTMLLRPSGARDDGVVASDVVQRNTLAINSAMAWWQERGLSLGRRAGDNQSQSSDSSSPLDVNKLFTLPDEEVEGIASDDGEGAPVVAPAAVAAAAPAVAPTPAAVPDRPPTNEPKEQTENTAEDEDNSILPVTPRQKWKKRKASLETVGTGIGIGAINKGTPKAPTPSTPSTVAMTPESLSDCRFDGKTDADKENQGAFVKSQTAMTPVPPPETVQATTMSMDIDTSNDLEGPEGMTWLEQMRLDEERQLAALQAEAYVPRLRSKRSVVPKPPEREQTQSVVVNDKADNLHSDVNIDEKKQVDEIDGTLVTGTNGPAILPSPFPLSLSDPVKDINDIQEDKQESVTNESTTPADTTSPATLPTNERTLIDIDEECLKLMEAENRNTTFIASAIVEEEEDDDKGDNDEEDDDNKVEKDADDDNKDKEADDNDDLQEEAERDHGIDEEEGLPSNPTTMAKETAPSSMADTTPEPSVTANIDFEDSDIVDLDAVCLSLMDEEEAARLQKDGTLDKFLITTATSYHKSTTTGESDIASMATARIANRSARGTSRNYPPIGDMGSTSVMQTAIDEETGMALPEEHHNDDDENGHGRNNNRSNDSSPRQTSSSSRRASSRSRTRCIVLVCGILLLVVAAVLIAILITRRNSTTGGPLIGPDPDASTPQPAGAAPVPTVTPVTPRPTNASPAAAPAPPSSTTRTYMPVVFPPTPAPATGNWTRVGNTISIPTPVNDMSTTTTTTLLSVSINTDGQYVAIGSPTTNSASVLFFSSSTNSWFPVGQTLTDSSSTEFGRGCIVSANGRAVAVYSSTFVRVHQWNPSNLLWIQKGNNDIALPNNNKDINVVAFSSDGSTVVVVTTAASARLGAGTVRVYRISDTNNGVWVEQTPIVSGQDVTRFQDAVDVSSDGNVLVVAGTTTASSSMAALVYSYNDISKEYVLLGSPLYLTMDNSMMDYPITSVAISDNGTTVVAGGGGPGTTTAIWELTTSSNNNNNNNNTDWTRIGPLLLWAGTAVDSLELSVDGATVAIQTNERVRVLDRQFNEWVQRGQDELVMGPLATALSGDGNTVIVGSFNSTSTNGEAAVFLWE